MSLSLSQQIEQDIVDFVCDSEKKVSPMDLDRYLPGGHGKRQIRLGLKNLMSRSILTYTQFYGRTFIEKSFNRPVRVSERVILTPSSIKFDGANDDILISLQHGESFGTGSHPTTRLSIAGIEQLFLSRGDDVPRGSCVDIGTGSGILAIAAVLFGMDDCVGVDIDLCAVHEAKDNVSLNGLSDRIEIFQEFDLLSKKDNGLVVANLRCPTLVSLSGVIKEILEPKGYVVFSGIKCDELKSLKTHYEKEGFSCLWDSSDKQWSGVVFRKGCR